MSAPDDASWIEPPLPLSRADRARVLDAVLGLDDTAARQAWWAARPALRAAVTSSDDLFLDARDGQLYPVVHLAGLAWLGRNLAVDVGDGCSAWGDREYVHESAADERAFGLLYEATAATRAVPDGWRLPTDGDWRTLLAWAGGANADGVKDEAPGRASYARLVVGGDSGFDAQLAGVRDPDDRWWHRRGRQGQYWTSTPSSLSPIDGQPRICSWTFTARPRFEVRRGATRADQGLSVRLVRDPSTGPR